MKALVQDETLPDLERLSARLIKFESDACTEVNGGVDLEGEIEAAWKTVEPFAVNLEQNAPVSLQGAAAKIRCELLHRIVSAPDETEEEDGSECRLLSRAIEALEGTPAISEKAA